MYARRWAPVLLLVTAATPAALASLGDLTIAATLDGAEGNGDVKVVSDPNVFLFKFMAGAVTVRDASGLAVAGADVLGVVTYRGSVASPAGVEVGRFEGVTGDDGSTPFVYRHDVAGVTGGSGLATLPGYHEIDISAAAAGPGGELLTGSLVYKYWVRP